MGSSLRQGPFFADPGEVRHPEKTRAPKEIPIQRATQVRGHTYTHRPLSSSFLGLPERILNINHIKELLRGLWIEAKTLYEKSKVKGP